MMYRTTNRTTNRQQLTLNCFWGRSETKRKKPETLNEQQEKSKKPKLVQNEAPKKCFSLFVSEQSCSINLAKSTLTEIQKAQMAKKTTQISVFNQLMREEGYQFVEILSDNEKHYQNIATQELTDTEEILRDINLMVGGSSGQRVGFLRGKAIGYYEQDNAVFGAKYPSTTLLKNNSVCSFQFSDLISNTNNFQKNGDLDEFCESIQKIKEKCSNHQVKPVLIKKGSIFEMRGIVDAMKEKCQTDCLVMAFNKSEVKLIEYPLDVAKVENASQKENVLAYQPGGSLELK